MKHVIPQINSTTYYLGTNDRTKPLFENLWPIPDGVAYNRFIKDEKTVVIDTVDSAYAEVSWTRWITSSPVSLSITSSSTTWNPIMQAPSLSSDRDAPGGANGGE